MFAFLYNNGGFLCTMDSIIYRLNVCFTRKNGAFGLKVPWKYRYARATFKEVPVRRTGAYRHTLSTDYNPEKYTT